MGNRAVITQNKSLNEVGIYLHWNGGRDSIEGFLAYCLLKKDFRGCDEQYGFARLLNVIANFFSDGLSVGVDKANKLDCDNYDNGVYIIKGFDIVGRMYHEGREQLEYDLKSFVEDVDEHMPEKMRLAATEWAHFDEVKKRILLFRDNQEHTEEEVKAYIEKDEDKN